MTIAAVYQSETKIQDYVKQEQVIGQPNNNSIIPLKNPRAEILRNNEKSKEYFYLGNILANAIETEGYCDSQLYEDLFTIIAEDQIRNNFGFYFYDRDRSELPKINEQLARGIDSQYSQIPEYELPRNLQNYLNNINLVNARFDTKSPFHLKPFLEVSPPPKSDDTLLQSKINERGYTDHSYVILSIPMQGSDGKVIERAIQLWTDKVNENEWQLLFDKLKASADTSLQFLETAGFSNSIDSSVKQYGADILARGGFLGEMQQAVLFQFLSEYGIEIKFDQLEEIGKIKSEFIPNIKNRLDEILNIAINQSRYFTEFDEIEPYMAEISRRMIAMNSSLRLYVDKLFGNEAQITYEEFQGMGDEDRLSYAQKHGFEIKFCGGRLQSSNSFLGELHTLGKVCGENTKEKPDLSDPCEYCGARWPIKIGDSKTYEPQCPNCGKSAKC